MSSIAEESIQNSEQKKDAVVKRVRPQVMMGERGLAIDNLDAAIRFAQGLIDGGMVPKGTRSPGAVVGLIEAGKELGLAPMYALSNLTFTNGRLGIMGDAAKALIRARGVLKAGTDFEEIYEGKEFTEEWKCTVTAWRDGQAKPFSRSFSIEKAITAGLIRLEGKKVLTHSREGGWGSHSAPWSTYTERMLMYRALGFLVRDYFSDILGGAVLTEELRDYPQERILPAAPPEPDPLLVDAPSNAPEGPQAHEAEIVTAETPTEPIAQQPLPSEAAEPVQTPIQTGPSEEEQRIAREVERLEGRLTMAESIEQLEKEWGERESLRDGLSDSEKKRLLKLYKQLRKNFE